MKLNIQDKVIMAVVALVILVGAIIFFTRDEEYTSKVPAESVLNEIDINEFVDIYNGAEKSILYIARPTCSYCVMFEPIVNEVGSEYDLVFNYYDTDKMLEPDYNLFVETAPYFAEEGIATPTTLIVENGVMIDVLGGYVEAAGLIEFLEKNGLIGAE